MSCSKYDLQGLHAGVYIARETNGRLGKYQHIPSTWRAAHSLNVELILPLRDSSEIRAAGKAHDSHILPPPGMLYDQLDHDDTPKPTTIVLYIMHLLATLQ